MLVVVVDICAPETYGTRVWRSVLINDRRAGDVWEKESIFAPGRIIGYSCPHGSSRACPSIEAAALELVSVIAQYSGERSYFWINQHATPSNLMREIELTIHEPVIAMRLGEVVAS